MTFSEFIKILAALWFTPGIVLVLWLALCRTPLNRFESAVAIIFGPVILFTLLLDCYNDTKLKDDDYDGK